MMTTSNDEHVAVLNGLIAATLDSAHGYRAAAAATQKAKFKSLFEARGRQRRDSATALQAEVQRLGGKLEGDGIMLGDAHRLFARLKDAVTGDDQSVVAEVDAGEAYVQAKFADALALTGLPASVEAAVARANESVLADRDEMRSFKHSLSAAPG